MKAEKQGADNSRPSDSRPGPEKPCAGAGKYTVAAKNPSVYEKTSDLTRVFLDPQALMDFIASYFSGQP